MVREQITQLAASPGVIGCCLLARDGAVLVNAMPEFVSPEQIQAASDAVVEGILGLETLEEGAWEMDLAFTEVLCIVRPVATTVLMVLVDPDANLPVLKLAMNVTAKRIAAAPSHELEELRAGSQPRPVGGGEEILPPEAVKAVLDAIRSHLVQATGSDALVDQTLRSTGLDLEAPTRPALRDALTEILEKGLARTLGRAEATRWLNQLVKHYGLAKQPS